MCQSLTGFLSVSDNLALGEQKPATFKDLATYFLAFLGLVGLYNLYTVRTECVWALLRTPVPATAGQKYGYFLVSERQFWVRPVII
jgi:hypothetical protein